MANRYFNQFRLSLEKQVCTIFANVAFNASSAPVLSAANSKGVVSITRNNTGLYTFVFGTKNSVGPTLYDTYYKLASVSVTWDVTAAAGTSPTAPNIFVNANSISTANVASIQLGFFTTAASGTQVDPAATDVGLFEFNFRNSNAP